jgi:DNA invertase Pin-like site-specific DNA recombinase
MQDGKDYKTAVCRRVAVESPTALYCRTAGKTNPPDNTGTEKQKHRLLRFAKEHGYENPVLYIDNGESGITLDRPAMNRLTDDIKSGRVKTVIVTSADRIARNIGLLTEWVSFLKGAGVRCLSLDADGRDIAIRRAFARNLPDDLYPGLSGTLNAPH